MDGESGSVNLVLERKLSSKSRPVPAVLRYDADEQDRAGDGFVYQSQLFSDPQEDLLESYVATVARSALRSCGVRWNKSGKFAVDIELGTIEAGAKADLDNVTKLIFDGLTGVLWDEDAQVQACCVRRSLVTRKQQTPTTVRVTPL